MKKLIDYACSLSPTFRDEIKGAPRAQIDQLERIVGKQLPPFYREYLEVACVEDNGLLSTKDLKTDPPSLIFFYEEEVFKGEDSVPDDCITVAVSGVTGVTLFLEVEGQGALYNGALSEKITLWASSFERCLYHSLFIRYRALRLPSPKTIAHFSNNNRTHALTRARAAGEELGFNEVWFSDQVTYCAERADAVLVIQQMSNHSPYVQIAATKNETVTSIVQELERASGVALKLTGTGPVPRY